MKIQIVRHILLGVALACFHATLPAAEVINNGGFESSFSGWTRANSTGSDGNFFLQTGTASPVNGIGVPTPPGGTTAAMTDAQGPGSHVLYQDFTVSASIGTATLTFDTFLGNQAGTFFTPNPNTLDFGIAAFNQQARVDILLGSASPFSVASSDVLLNLFQTTPGSDAPFEYTAHSAEIGSILNAHLNTVLRLRFAETDNVSTFQFGVDNVGLQTSPVPEPSSLFTGCLGAIVCLALVHATRSKGIVLLVRK